MLVEWYYIVTFKFHYFGFGKPGFIVSKWTSKCVVAQFLFIQILQNSGKNNLPCMMFLFCLSTDPQRSSPCKRKRQFLIMGQQQKDDSRRTSGIILWRRCKTLPFSKVWIFVSYNEDLRTKGVQLWCAPGDFRWFEVVVPNLVQPSMSLERVRIRPSKLACVLTSHW